MGIPVYVPNIQPAPLVTDVMARISQGEAISQTAVQKAQLGLEQQQAQINAEASRSAAEQQANQIAQQQAAFAAQSAPFQRALLQAQTKEAQARARGDLAPAKDTTMFGQILRIKHAVNSGQITPQTGALLADTIVKGKKGGLVNIGISPSGATLSAGGGTSPTVGGALLSGGVGGKDPLVSPVSVVPNTGQTSRGSQGATKIDANNNVITIPTRSTTGFLQQRIAGQQSANKPLGEYAKGVLPYVGILGKGRFLEDLVTSSLFKQKDAIERLKNYGLSTGMIEGLSEELARAQLGAAPTETSINGWKAALNPHLWQTKELFNATVDGAKNILNATSGSAKKDIKQGGISVGKLSNNGIRALHAAAKTPTIGELLFPHEQALMHASAVSEGKAPIAPVMSTKHLNQSQKGSSTDAVKEKEESKLSTADLIKQARGE
jgi:hypothetical protein